MSIKQLETEVQKQSKLLAAELPSLMEKFKGKFVAYFNGDMQVADTHEDCFNLAAKKYGDSGFVIDQISSQKLVLSGLIKF